MTNASPDSRSACASHLLLYPRRLAHTPAAERLLYGVSYDRALFDRLGRFREDLREGEDTEFNSRVRRLTEIVWDQNVRTAHRNPTSPISLLRDQFARGLRAGVYDHLRASTMIRVCAFKMPRDAVMAAWGAPEDRRRLLGVAPLMPAAALAFTSGQIGARARRRRVGSRAFLTGAARSTEPHG
jgi:hypothetical protein